MSEVEARSRSELAAELSKAGAEIETRLGLAKHDAWFGSKHRIFRFPDGSVCNLPYLLDLIYGPEVKE